jgi:hypothetical protein
VQLAISGQSFTTGFEIGCKISLNRMFYERELAKLVFRNARRIDNDAPTACRHQIRPPPILPNFKGRRHICWAPAHGLSVPGVHYKIGKKP